MEEQDPRIIDLDPEHAPRVTAVILLICGVMAVGFYLVNAYFTGADQYYIEQEWEEGTEPVNQRYDITPNLIRGKHPEDSDEEEDAHAIPVKKPVKKPATTNPLASPFGNPFQLPATPGSPTTQGTVGKP